MTNDTQPVETAAAPNNKKRNMILLLVSALFLALGLGYLAYWIMYGRFHQETDDAYVNGNQIMVTPLVPGIITSIACDNTDYVEEGQPLLYLDKTDSLIALEKAKSNLANTVRKVVDLFAKVEELKASIDVKKAELLRVGRDYEHRQELKDTGAISEEDFQHAETSLYAAVASLNYVQTQYLSALAQVEGTSIDTHPEVNIAKDQVRYAWVQLQRCTISAPVSGIVAQRSAQVGEWVSTNKPLLSIVPLGQIWIDANFKENQLRDIRIHQEVEITADMYGSDVVYHGKVLGINPGTGSIFSVLPPQNATGNWIKIVQRVPVRIALQQDEIKKHPLMLGLSMNVNVNTRDIEGPRLQNTPPTEILYQTPIFSDQEKGVEELIQKIIEENIPHDE